MPRECAQILQPLWDKDVYPVIIVITAGINKTLSSQEHWPDPTISQPDHSPRENHLVTVS